VPLEKPRGRPRQETPSPDNPAATTQLPDRDSLVDFVPAYLAIMADRFGDPTAAPVYESAPRRSSRAARARAQGRQSWLVLCELRPVQADLDLDGGDQQ
jgi:hypothetical protein